MYTNADLLVEILHNLGTRYASGVPGRCIEPLYEALARANQQSHIHFLTAKHEAGAVAIAEGCARMTDNLEVCCATTGPGALNMVGALVSADFERIPLLAITAQTQLHRIGKGAFQDSSDEGVNIVGLLKQVCRYSSLVSHADQLIPKLRTAWLSAMQYPRGPVHLAIPPELLSMACSADHREHVLSHIHHWTEPLHSSAEHDLLEVLTRFSRVTRPCLVLGNEARYSKEAIFKFVEAFNIPVVATAGGHGWFPTTHPCFFGVVGLGGHDTAKHIVQASDGVLLLGSYYRDLCVASTPALSTASTLHVAPTLVSAASTPIGVPVVQTSIDRVLETLQQMWSTKRPHLLQRQKAPSTGALDLPEDSPPLLLSKTLKALNQPLHVLFDAGNAWSWALHHLDLPEDWEFTLSMGVGQMAWAIPTSIGCALADLSRQTVCVTGDGSWLMCSHEIATAVQYKIPVVFIVLNDGKLGMVRHGQAVDCASDAHSDLPSVDFARIAEAYGVPAYRVRSAAQLQEQVATLQAKPTGPILIELLVSPEFTPPLSQGVRGPSPVMRNLYKDGTETLARECSPD